MCQHVSNQSFCLPINCKYGWLIDWLYAGSNCWPITFMYDWLDMQLLFSFNSSWNIKTVCRIRNNIYLVYLQVASCLKTIQVGNRKWFPRNINLTFCVESGTMFVVIAFGICLDSNFTSNSWPFQDVCKTTLHLHHWIHICFCKNCWVIVKR